MQNGLRLSVGPLPDPVPTHDTLVVAGGPGTAAAADEPAVVDGVLRASRRARRTVSVCTGAFLLAAAGLFDSRRATTHWAFSDQLASRFPSVDVDPDLVFHDEDVCSSAGIAAGIDLALALVDDDLGPGAALAVAQALVVFLKRPGGQAQFSRSLSAQQALRPELRELQAWIAGHPPRGPDRSVMAQRALTSERFIRPGVSLEVGQPPGRVRRGTADRTRPRSTRGRRSITRSPRSGHRLRQR